jgi:S-methylmethionine-dependent homocysteine/selenocysteine methylase
MSESPARDLESRLSGGGTVLIDGATGTELERRGAGMDDACWCGRATLSHGDILLGIHDDYIRLGCDLVTANTFASGRAMLDPAGLGGRFEEINRRAVEIALEARDRAAAGRPVAVAGSMSHMVPIAAGADRRDPRAVPEAARAEAMFAEMAALLADAGVDLIVMEMMSDPDLAVPAVRAAAATGLPVWVGFSTRPDENGTLVSWHRPELPIAEAILPIMAAGGSVAGIMHTEMKDMDAALAILKDVWDGPRMAYPESGHFEMPHWELGDLAPAEFASRCLGWLDRGVQVVGGCCGVGIEHMAALAEALQGRRS